jgi:hypothetical protein
MTQQDLALLIERARQIEMTPRDREEQRRSFAYGNANIENAAVTREVVEKVANELASSKCGDSAKK